MPRLSWARTLGYAAMPSIMVVGIAEGVASVWLFGMARICNGMATSGPMFSLDARKRQLIPQFDRQLLLNDFWHFPGRLIGSLG